MRETVTQFYDPEFDAEWFPHGGGPVPPAATNGTVVYLAAALASAADSFKASALSVASQVKLASLRPKWPKAAVLR